MKIRIETPSLLEPGLPDGATWNVTPQGEVVFVAVHKGKRVHVFFEDPADAKEQGVGAIVIAFQAHMQQIAKEKTSRIVVPGVQ